MTNTELREYLKRCGLTQTDAAAMLEISARMMRRYCAGHAVIPATVEYALYWVTNAGR